MNKQEKLNYLSGLDMASLNIKIGEDQFYSAGIYGSIETMGLVCSLLTIDYLTSYMIPLSSSYNMVTGIKTFDNKDSFVSMVKKILEIAVTYKNWIISKKVALNNCSTEEEAELISVEDAPALDATI